MKERAHPLDSRHITGRVALEEAGVYLGYSVQEMSVLVRYKIVRILGTPVPQNARKYVARTDLLEWLASRDFQEKACRCLYRFHRERNQKYVLAKRAAAGLAAKTAA